MQVVDKPSAFATALKTLLERNMSYKQAVALYMLSQHFASVPDFGRVMHPDYAVVVNSLAVMLKDERLEDKEDD